MDVIESNILDIIFDYTKKGDLFRFTPNNRLAKKIICFIKSYIDVFKSILSEQHVDSFNKLFCILHQLYHESYTYIEEKFEKVILHSTNKIVKNIYHFVCNYLKQLCFVYKKGNIRTNYIQYNNNFMNSLSVMNDDTFKIISDLNSRADSVLYAKRSHENIFNKIQLLLENSYLNHKVIDLFVSIYLDMSMYDYTTTVVLDLCNLFKNKNYEKILSKENQIILCLCNHYFNELPIICENIKNEQFENLLNYLSFDFKHLHDYFGVLERYLDEKFLRHVIDNAYNIDSPSRNNFRAIHRLSRGGCIRITKLLNEKGIDLNIQDPNGWAPIHLACYNDHVDFVQYLLDSNVDIDVPNEDGNKPIHLACRFNYMRIIQLIIDRFPNQLEAIGEEQLRPIHYACINNKFDIILFLVHGTTNKSEDLQKIVPRINLNCVDNSGKRPIDHVKKSRIKNFLERKMEIQNRTIFSHKTKQFEYDIDIFINERSCSE